MQPFSGGYMYGGPQGPQHEIASFGTGNPYAVPYGYSPYPPGGVPMGYSGPMDMTMMGTGLPLQRPAHSASSGQTPQLDVNGQASQAQLDETVPLQLELPLEVRPAPMLRGPPLTMHGPPMVHAGGAMSSQMPYMIPSHDPYYGYIDPGYGYMQMMEPPLYLPPASRHQYMPPPGAFAPLGPMHLPPPHGLASGGALDGLAAAERPLVLPPAVGQSTPDGSSTGASQQQVAPLLLPQSSQPAAAALNSSQTLRLASVGGLGLGLQPAAASGGLFSLAGSLGPVNLSMHSPDAQKAAGAAEMGMLASPSSAPTAADMSLLASLAPDQLPGGGHHRRKPLSTATEDLYATPRLLGTALCSPRPATAPAGPPPTARQQPAQQQLAPPATAPPDTTTDAAAESAADTSTLAPPAALPANTSAVLASAAAARAAGGAAIPPSATNAPVQHAPLAAMPPLASGGALGPSQATSTAGIATSAVQATAPPLAPPSRSADTSQPAAAAASTGPPPSEHCPRSPAAALPGRQAPQASSSRPPLYGPMVTALLEATAGLPHVELPLSTGPACSALAKALAGTSTDGQQVGAMAAQQAPAIAQVCQPTSADSFQTLDLERATVAKLARTRLQEQREAGRASKDACRTELLATAGVLVGEPVLARKVIRYKKRGVSINVMEQRGTLTEKGFIQCHCGCSRSHTLTAWEAHCVPKLNRSYVIGQFICFPRLQISMENLAWLAQCDDPEGGSRSLCRHCWEPACPLTCSACKGSFHTECVKMGKRIPPVVWTCLECSTRPNLTSPGREQQQQRQQQQQQQQANAGREEFEIMEIDDDDDDDSTAAAEATPPAPAPAAPASRPVEAPALEDTRPLKRLRTAATHTSSNEDECTPLTIPGDLPDPPTAFALPGTSNPAASTAAAPPAACAPHLSSAPWGTYALDASAVGAAAAGAGTGLAAAQQPSNKQPTPVSQAADQEQPPATSAPTAPTAPPPAAQQPRCQSPVTSLPLPPSEAQPQQQGTPNGPAPSTTAPDPPPCARSPSPLLSRPQPFPQEAPAPNAAPQASLPTPSGSAPAHPPPPAVSGGVQPRHAGSATTSTQQAGTTAQRDQQLPPLLTLTSAIDAAALHYRLQQLENRLAAKNKQLASADSRCTALQHRAERAEADATGLRQQFQQAEKDSDTTLRAFQVALAAKAQDVAHRCRQLEVYAAQRASLNHTIFGLRMQLSRLNCLAAAPQMEPQKGEQQQQQQGGGGANAGGKPLAQGPGSDARLLEAELQAKQAVIAEKETVIARLRSSHAVHRSGAARDMAIHIQQLQSLSTAALLASSTQEATTSQAPANSATARDVAVKLQALTHKISDTASMLANDSDLESQLAELQQMLRQMQVQGAQSMMMAVTEKDKCIAELQSRLMHLKSQMEASSALMLTLQCTLQPNAKPAAGQLQHELQQ